MVRKQSTLEDLAEQSTLIATAVRSGELQLVIPSSIGGDRPIGDLPSDELAVDYIIQSPEHLG